MKSIIFLVIFFSCCFMNSRPAWAVSNHCSAIHGVQSATNESSMVEGLSLRSKLWQGLRKVVRESDSKRGYFYNAGLLAGFIYASAQVNAVIPKDMVVLSQMILIGSVTTLYALAAPLSEPFSSFLRHVMYSMNEAEGRVGVPTKFKLRFSRRFEAIWARLQPDFSLNGQVGRNSMAQAMNSVLIRLHGVPMNLNFRDPEPEFLEYGMGLIVSAAFFLHTNHPEIDPQDRSMVMAVRSFLNMISAENQKKWIPPLERYFLPLLKACYLDPIDGESLEDRRLMEELWNDPETMEYYRKLIRAWFGYNLSNY